MRSFQNRRRQFVRSFLLALGAVLTFGAAQEALAAETSPAGALKRELIYLGDIPVGVMQ